MIILPVHQNTPEWHAARIKYSRTASKAPAMMGASKYQSRSDLLRQEASGITPEIAEATQALFDAGHAVEEPARKMVEKHLKAPLLPLTCTTDDGYLLASFDGINEELRAGWECKLWNQKLAGQVHDKQLDPHYYWQLEQQAIVGNLDYIIFTCSDGTPRQTVHMKYVPVPGRAEQLLAGWHQFDADLAAYTPPEVIPAVTAAPVMALPALSIVVNGAISLTDNLALFGAGLKAFIERLPAKPETDQQFADCKAALTTLKDAENALDAAEAHALGQMASFDMMKRAKALLFDLSRTTRIALEKLVAAEEQNIKAKIVQAARALYDAHVESLKEETGGPWILIAPPDFAGAVKNKRNIASTQNAVDTALANGKIAADASAKLIRANLACLKDDGVGYEFLFNDRLALIGKPIDDLRILIKSRIDHHKAAEAVRLEKERERIRQEEIDKLAQKAADEWAAKDKAKPVEQQKPTGDLAQSLLPGRSGTGPSGGGVTPAAIPKPKVSVAAAASPEPSGGENLRALIADLMGDMTPGELQQALDSIRAIRAARQQRKSA